MRQIVVDLERMKLPTKTSGMTGESSRLGSDDTARRPPSVKASLSVSFGQRAPHRASTRDSSPVRRTLPPPCESSHGRERPDRCRGRERVRDRDRDWDRDRERRYDCDRRGGDRDSRERDSHYSDRRDRDYERSGRDSDRRRDSSSCRSRSRSRSMQVNGASSDRRPSPFKDGNRERISSNLAKLKDLYGDASDNKGDAGSDRLRKDSSTEEVIRLGGSSWKT